MQKKYKKTFFLLIIGLIIFYLLLHGIKPNSSKYSSNYWYCWNNFTLKKFLKGTDPHHYGHRVIGDHPCTLEELK